MQEVCWNNTIGDGVMIQVGNIGEGQKAKGSRQRGGDSVKVVADSTCQVVS